MGLKPMTRNYKMADADLIQTADHIKACVTRDAAGLASRGVTTENVNDLNDARTAFAEFPTDEELEGAKTAAVEIKDGKRGVLEVELRTIRGIADDVYKGHGLYKTFGFEGLTEATDNNFVRQAKRIHRVSTTLQTTLEPKGMTDARLTMVEMLVGEMDNAIDAVDTATMQRDIQTQQRIAIGNDLFDIVMELANTGKSYYADTDEAKFNDYVINDTPAPPPPPAKS